MANLRQFRSLTFGLSAGALALAMVFVLALVASQTAQAQTFQVLYTFKGGLDGVSPVAGVTFDAAGNLYGTTEGFFQGYGTVYKLSHKGSGWVVDPLYSFTGSSDGANPQAGVIFGPDGALYGTTYDRGNGGKGTVFKLKPPPVGTSPCSITKPCPWTITVLHSFEGGGDGAYPSGGDLVFDQAGNMYGTTVEGGVAEGVEECRLGCGTVYELTPSGSGWMESVLHSFGIGDGSGPQSGVILDNSSNLYGTTSEGGDFGEGTVFELTYMPGVGWTESVLHSFQGFSEGGYPLAGLIFDQSGNLYGATTSGGSGGGGTVFELSPSGGGWTYTLLYSFTTGYCGPYGSLTMDGAGDLYGTTYCDGPYGYGNVFKLTPSSPYWTYTSLHDFTNGRDGCFPVGNVVFDANGNLYGTTKLGGEFNCPPPPNQGSGGYGVVWEVTP